MPSDQMSQRASYPVPTSSQLTVRRNKTMPYFKKFYTWNYFQQTSAYEESESTRAPSEIRCAARPPWVWHAATSGAIQYGVTIAEWARAPACDSTDAHRRTSCKAWVGSSLPKQTFVFTKRTFEPTQTDKRNFVNTNFYSLLYTLSQRHRLTHSLYYISSC